ISNPGTSSPPLVNRRRTGAGIMLSMAGMALSYAAFCWSHPPTAYQFSLVLGIYVLILSITRKDWKGLVYTGAAIAMGLALSAAYLYPAFAEKDLIWSAVLARDFPYDGTYVFTSGDAFFTLINRSWTLNLVAILVCGAGLLVLARRRIRGGLYPLASRVRLWVAIGAFATFMMTRYSDQIGCRIPMLTIGVFSWRMLSITTLIAALLIGACVEAASIASVARTKARYALLATAAVLVITAAAFTIARVIAPVYSAPLVDQDTEQLDDTILPRTVHVEPEDLPQSDPATLANGNGQVAVKQWAPQHRQLSVDLSDRDQLAIRTFNFPGWTATVDGQKAELGTGEDLGEITLNLERGKHLITLDYLETPLRRRADAVTLFAFFVVFGAIGVACGIKWRERRARVHLDWAPDRSLEFASDTEIVAVTDAGRAEPASVRVKQGAP
ncbi:MAG TPA: hypothetical protein VJX67_08025, partial [Blastocatellia bacterium]|nr:hypothetical protein [Blastocatellia bacterium]